MGISPPFGYKEVVPFYKNQKVRLLKTGEVAPFARNLNAIPISYTEFALVSHDYPIVFTSGGDGATFVPVAVLGTNAGENLFIRQNAWAARVYVPAYARRFPFCMSRVTLDNVVQQDRLICVEKEFSGEDGEPMFDQNGAPLEKWKEIERLLSDYEADLERSREMCGLLSEYGLLEPFTLQAASLKGRAVHLAGMHRVDETKIEHLDASRLRNLVKTGVLSRIYAHLLSLENFSALIERKVLASAGDETGVAVPAR